MGHRRSLGLFEPRRLLPIASLGSLLLVAAAVVNLVLKGPAADLLIFAALVIAFLIMAATNAATRHRIDVRLGELINDARHFKVVATEFADYRFVDVFNAIERQLKEQRIVTLDLRHQESLGVILAGFLPSNQFSSEEAPRSPCAVAPDEQRYLSGHRFWVRRLSAAGCPLIARLRKPEYPGQAVQLEVAAEEEADAERFVSEIRESSVTHSVYRGATLDVSMLPGVTDAFGSIDHSGKVRVEFRRLPAIRSEEMVIDPRVWPILEHSLVEFQKNYRTLSACGVALKRGFLFYGPPGTGKSFTARYVASQLPGTTAVAGESLPGFS